MLSVSLHSDHEVDLAREFARLMGHQITADAVALRFAPEHAAELEALALDASNYWRRLKKPAKATAAERLRSAVAEARIIESALTE